MIAIKSFGITGVSGYIVDVEVDIAKGLPGSERILPEHLSEAISYRTLDCFNRGANE